MKNRSLQADQVVSLIRQKEREYIEFKRTTPSPFKMAKEMTAMANTVGGNILVGVDDEGIVVGVYSVAEEKRLIIQAAQEFCSPPLDPQIKTVSIDGKVILLVCIEPAAATYSVIAPQGKALLYVRVHDKNLIASKKTAQRLQDGPCLRLSHADFGRHEKLLLGYFKKHQNITLQEFCRQANLSKRRASRILVKLEKAALIRSHDFDKRIFYTLNPRSSGKRN